MPRACGIQTQTPPPRRSGKALGEYCVAWAVGYSTSSSTLVRTLGLQGFWVLTTLGLLLVLAGLISSSSNTTRSTRLPTMQMLTKFESKSNRVKGVAFHPSLPLLAATLHNGSVQLWNYQTGTIVDRLDQHTGPVRGADFHPTQPLLVTSGDDYQIKVWNHKTRQCLFTLSGHLDYVRTVFFHPVQPWILSASDDQTIRIWNWQSRQCIAILTGHNHYAMSAQFHPTQDLIVSASMDQTVRVWDISGLRQKSDAASGGDMMASAAAAAGQPKTLEDHLARAAYGAGAGAGAGVDMFGNTDAMVKYVLEGHDRGVNWAAFHPTLPLIVSAGDDRQVKLWRMSETKAWEVDTCRGHFNNVSSALFHPRHGLIISASEDKTIRVWDLEKRTAVQTFRREVDRFWVLTAHPTVNLFAAGHDNGLIVFKLERERPAHTVHQNSLYYVRDKQVRHLDFATNTDVAVLSLENLGSKFTPPRSLSFNPAERSIIAVATAGNDANAKGSFHLAPLPRDTQAATQATLPDSAQVGVKGSCSSAIFVARNRFAVLSRATQTIEVRDLNNVVTKTITCPTPTFAAQVTPTTAGTGVTDLFPAGTGQILLSTPAGVMLFDLGQQRVLAELANPPVKYVARHTNGQLALLSKHTLTLVQPDLSQPRLIHETIRIKSGGWDESGVVIYTTLNHIKYALPSGDHGIIKTLRQPVYVIRARGKSIVVLDRQGQVVTIPVDPTEYRFKLALAQERYEDVLSLIQHSNLVGQAIIAYLQKKGYPEIALHFVSDPTTRFDLALETGNLEVALEMAETLGADEVWRRLAETALRLGNTKVVERALQKTKRLEQLSFLYLITGSQDKLAKMAGIADKRGDALSRFQNALFLGDASKQTTVLNDVGLGALAYAKAVSSGLPPPAGVTPPPTATCLPEPGTSTLGLPPVITPASVAGSWPHKPGTESFFDRALAAGATAEALEEEEPEDWLDNEDGFASAQEENDPEGVLAATGGVLAAPEGDAGGEAWDLEDDVGPVAAAEDDVALPALVDPATEGELVPGSDEAEHWLRNSVVPAVHAAAGSFETAMLLLQRQVGIVAFAPLKPLFMAVSLGAKASLPAAPGFSPLGGGDLAVPLREDVDQVDPSSRLPARLWSVQDLAQSELVEAYKAVAQNRLSEAETLFRALLYKAILTRATSASEAAEVADLVTLCREYILGVSIELERRRLVGQDASFAHSTRGLELALLFTRTQLQPAHQLIALRSGMGLASKAGNLLMASYFAKRILSLSPAERVGQQAQQVISLADRNPRDLVPIDYNQDEGTICAGSFTWISGDVLRQPGGTVRDPLTGAVYLARYHGQLALSHVSQVGRSGTGLRAL